MVEGLGFWFDLFLEARAEILKKFVGFLVEMMAPKKHFEINWHLKIQEDNVAILEFISFEVLYCASNPGIQ